MNQQLSIPGFYRPAKPPNERDICARKHGGDKMSKAAHERVKPTKILMRERCRIFIAGCDFHGATLAEICKAFGKEKNTLSGRLSELHKDGLIFDSRRTRERCKVWVARQEWVRLWDTGEIQP